MGSHKNSVREHCPVRQRRKSGTEKFSNQRKVIQLRSIGDHLKITRFGSSGGIIWVKLIFFQKKKNVAFCVPGILGLGTEVGTPMAGQGERKGEEKKIVVVKVIPSR